MTGKLALEELGWPPRERVAFERALDHENGLVLLVGQRESGITTATYAALRYVVACARRPVVSVEWPIARPLAGTVQIAVDSVAGASPSESILHALAMRPAVLATDVLVDHTSADLAFEAAERCLVIAALWQLSIRAALAQLREMGIPASTLDRLLRAAFYLDESSRKR